MDIGPAKAERADTGPAGPSRGPGPRGGGDGDGGRDAVCPDLGIEAFQVQVRWDGRGLQGNEDAADPGKTGGSLKVADVRLDGGDQQGAIGLPAAAVDIADGAEFDGVAQGRAGAVGFDAVDVRGRKPGVMESFAQQAGLGPAAGGRKAVAPAVLVDCRAADDAQDGILVVQGPLQRFKNEHHAAFGADIAVGVGGKGLAAAVRGHEMGVGEDILSFASGQDIDAAGKSGLAFAVPQAAAGQVQGQQRGRAGAVYGHARAFEPVEIGKAVGRDAVGVSRPHIGVEALAALETAVLVIGRADAREDACAAAAQAVRRDPGPLQGLPGDFQQQSLLGIDLHGFAGRDTEQSGIESADVVQKTAPDSPVPVFRSGRTVPVGGVAPGDGILAAEEQCLQSLGAVGARQTAGHADDGHRLLSGAVRGQRGFIGKVPGHERRQRGDVGMVIEQGRGQRTAAGLLQFPGQGHGRGRSHAQGAERRVQAHAVRGKPQARGKAVTQPVLPGLAGGGGILLLRGAVPGGGPGAGLFPPFRQYGQFAVKVKMAAQGLLDLAAGGLGHAMPLAEDDGAGGDVEFFGKTAPDGRQRRLVGCRGQAGLEDHDQPFAGIAVDAEGGSAILLQPRHVLQDAFLKVLREKIAAVEDDHFLASPGDEKMPPGHEAHVTCPQEGPFAGSGQHGMQDGLRGFGLFPVSRRNARPPDPDLAQLLFFDLPACLGIDDAHVIVAPGRAAGKQRHGIGVPLLQEAYATCGIFLLVEKNGKIAVIFPAACGEQRVLRKAVARIETGRIETGGTETLQETADGLQADGLGAAVADGKRTEIQLPESILRDAVAAKVVGKVGAARQLGAIVGDGAQPAERLAQKGHGRHGDAQAAQMERRQDAAHEAHVVEGGQPADGGNIFPEPHVPGDAVQIGHDVAVSDDDSFGAAGGAGGILQPSGRMRSQRKFLPGPGQGIVGLIKADDPYAIGKMDAFGQFFHRLAQTCGSDEDA